MSVKNFTLAVLECAYETSRFKPIGYL